MSDHEKFMRRAIELSRKAGIDEMTGGCFGAVIVKDGKIVGEGYNEVIKTNDPTRHGEMVAIAKASANLKTPHLEGCILYTSAEPCPMCTGAIYWSHIKKVYYAAKYEDVKKYGNFEDDDFMAELLKDPEERKIPLINISREEAVEVWEIYEKLPNKKHY